MSKTIHVKETSRPSDDAKSIVYGEKASGNGTIVGDHGHIVVDKNDGVTYARDMQGNVIYDSKKDK